MDDPDPDGRQLVESPAGELIEAAKQFIRGSRADATRRAYSQDWRHFETWCERCGVTALPTLPATVVIYLSALAQARLRTSTIRRRCAAIAYVHRHAGHDNPIASELVRSVTAGINRQLGAPPIKKFALTADLIGKTVRRIPTDVLGLRDRAVLLIGFAAALRRSEIVALETQDLTRHPKGLLLTLRRSKTDQVGEGLIKTIPHGKKLDAIAALDAWLAAAQITQGAVFRAVRGSIVQGERLTGGQIARIVKKRCTAVGIDPKQVAGHSLRSGFLTSASDAGASLQAMARHAGHAKLETTIGYIQVADAFRDHPGKRFL